MDVKQFKSLLLSTDGREEVAPQGFSGPVHAFRQRPAARNLLRRHLVSHLHLSAEGIVVVGSAKTGFSLSPEIFPRPFGMESDIDVVVVDETLFDAYWAVCLDYFYPRRMGM